MYVESMYGGTYIIGERAKRARHYQGCSYKIELVRYIYICSALSMDLRNL